MKHCIHVTIDPETQQEETESIATNKKPDNTKKNISEYLDLSL